MGVTRPQGVAGGNADRARRGVELFERHAARYDRWYDSGPGRVLFQAELEAVRLAVAGLPGPVLEIGVGTGRFAEALGAEVGVDPAGAVLEVYRNRLSRPAGGGQAGALRPPTLLLQADGAGLPFRDGSFGVALLIVTLCFAGDPPRLVAEAARVVRPGGAVVAAIIDRESPWGAWYLRKQAEGHLFYEHARFFTAAEVAGWMEEAGLQPMRVSSTLLQPPTDDPRPEPAFDHLEPQAGFVCLVAVKPAAYHASPKAAPVSQRRSSGEPVGMRSPVPSSATSTPARHCWPT